MSSSKNKLAIFAPMQKTTENSTVLSSDKYHQVKTSWPSLLRCRKQLKTVLFWVVINTN